MSDRSEIQQGIIANDQATIQINKVEQNFGTQPPKPTGDAPPTNLQDRGVARDRFFGRDDVLEELHQLLQKGEHRVAIASVDGMGGVGKTELAVQYARQHLHETYRGGVVWLAGERAGVELLNFARSRFFPTVDLADLGDLPEQLAYCFGHWPAQEVPPESVLLIFDDVTDYRTQVGAILPSDSRFRVLITTRAKFQGVERLELQVLTPEAALQLLESIVGTERIAAERATAEELCDWLGFLPLGIQLAGYYIVEEDCDLSELLQELEVRKRKLQHPALKTPEPTMTAQLGVEAAFELSWERLDLDARFIGAYLSLFAAAPIPWELVVSREEVSPEAYEAISTARRKLVRFSLLQKVGKLFQYHPLIKHFFSEKLEADEFIVPPSHQLTGATTEIRRLVGLEDE